RHTRGVSGSRHRPPCGGAPDEIGKDVFMTSSHINRREMLRRAAILGAGVPAMSALATTRAGAQSTPDAPTGDTIKIGASISSTGSNARTGQYQQEAYKLWEAQKNASGGLLGRPVEMVIYDDQSDPTTGSRLYEKLITEDEVDLVLGPYASSVSQAVAQITERYGYPLLIAGASSDTIWQSGFQSVFGVYSVASDYFKDIVTNIAPDQGYETAA